MGKGGIGESEESSVSRLFSDFGSISITKAPLLALDEIQTGSGVADPVCEPDGSAKSSKVAKICRAPPSQCRRL